jgi:hypothetical protein
MKKQILSFAIVATLLVSCGVETTETIEGTEKAKTEEVKEVLPVVADFKLDTETSKADWDRTLDQKPTKKKIKLFGKMVEMDLGEVKLTSNGKVQLKDGGLTTTDDVLTNATAIFDMATFKFAKEKGGGLFDVTKHPNSTLELSDFADSTAKGNLTIEGVSKATDVQVTTTKTDNGYTLTGSFTVNTLDFPLRETAKAKDINKDEIEVDFEFTYGK